MESNGMLSFTAEACKGESFWLFKISLWINYAFDEERENPK